MDKGMMVLIIPTGLIVNPWLAAGFDFVWCRFQDLQSARFIHARNRFYFIDPYGPEIVSTDLLTRLLVSCDSDDLTFDADKDRIEVYNSCFDLIGVLY
jgi:hypothetical protein